MAYAILLCWSIPLICNHLLDNWLIAGADPEGGGGGISYQGLIDPRSGERACNSAYACRDGKMLVVTKNRTTMRGRVAKAAVQSALTFKL